MAAYDINSMHDALVAIEKLAHCDLGCVYKKYRHHFDDIIGGIERIARAALKKPPRNCDVGSATEQAARFIKFCKGHRELLPGRCEVCSVKCPCRQCGDLNLCVLFWAQIPYEEKGAK